MAQLADGRARWSQCRLFFANLETKVRLDGTGGVLGTNIDFEQDLGLDDTKTRIMAEGYWRFFERHRLDVSYFDLDRSGVELSGNVITVNAGVKWQLLKHFNLGLLYQYFRIDVNTKDEAAQLTIDYKYKGPVLYAGWSF